VITVIKKYDYSDLTEKIIAASFEIHRILGPGFSERIYINSLKDLFQEQSIIYEAEKEFVVKFRDKIVGKFRVDFLVESKVIVEIKSVNGVLPKIFESQVVSYLKASGLKVGLLINFGNKSCEVRRLMLNKRLR